MKIKLFIRKQCWRPTAVGFLMVLGIVVLLCYLWLTNVYRFLTIQKIIPAKTMVIEGWVEDSVLKSALNYYRKNHFEHMIVTGISVSNRRLFANYTNFAQLAAAALKQMGFKDTIYEATLPMSIAIDRTYHTAIATKLLFKSHPKWEKRLMIYSEGVHSRRTKKMFDIALGDGFKTGIIAGTEHAFDSQHFWRTSKGFRTVSNEFVAYLWVCFFFHPDNEQNEKQLANLQYSERFQQERKEENREFAGENFFK